MLKIIKRFWPKVSWKLKKNKKFFENNLLNLDNSKARKKLKWKTKLDLQEGIKLTTDWYKFYLSNKKNKKLIYKKSSDQIKFYENLD